MTLTNTKLIKTIVFAAIILTIAIPMAEVKMVSATITGSDIVLDKTSDNQIPVQQQLRNELMTKLQAADSESSKKEIESELGNLDTSIQQWFKDHTDSQKEKLASEKHKILVDALMAEEAQYGGFKNRAQHLPWSTIGYDYVHNSLEVTILPEYFTADAIPKYFEKIRSIVGNDIDITLSPLPYPETTSCSSRTSACNPLTGGIQYSATDDPFHYCTTGYAATYNGWTGFVSAGHCVLGAGNIVQPEFGSVIGQQRVDAYYNLSTCDCAFISATIPVDNKIFGYSTTPNNTAPPFAGMTITYSGVGSNSLESGTVLATSTTISYPDGVTLNDQIKATIVVVQGDSGAAIVSGSSLVGFLSGHDANSNSYYTKESNVRSNISGLAWKFSYPP